MARKQLKDSTGVNFYPYADLESVIDESNNTLASILSEKQATLVSGTNIKTINNESLLGSGNISIEGGGSSMSITYNASTQALVIGSGSVNTYTITFNTASISDGFSVQINGGESIINQSPISVNEGDSVYVYCMTKTRPTATMGGESITVDSRGPEDFYFTIESVTGDIVVSF